MQHSFQTRPAQQKSLDNPALKGKKQTRQKNQRGCCGLLVSGWIFSDGTVHLEYLHKHVNNNTYIDLLKEKKKILFIKTLMKNNFILNRTMHPHVHQKRHYHFLKTTM